LKKAKKLEKSLEEIEKIKNLYKIEKNISKSSYFELIENLYHGKEIRIVEKFSCLIYLKVVNDSIKIGQSSKILWKMC